MIVAISIIGTITTLNLFLFGVTISALCDIQKTIITQGKDLNEFKREMEKRSKND